MKGVSQELYPFESHFENIGGHRYHYVEEGHGEPVVMLHGNPTWSFYYRDLIRKLSPHFHCLAPDHIGCGYSDKPNDDTYTYTLEQRVKDLEEFLEKKGITKNIHLVVHDWGGIIGMAYAHRHPQSIRKIVLMNTAAFHLPKGKRFPFVLKLARTWLGAAAIRGYNAFSGIATIEGTKRIKLTKAIRRGLTAPYNSWKNRIATLRFVQDVPLKPGDAGYDLISAMEQHLNQFNKTPTLIAWGMKDFVFDRSILETWIHYLPQAHVYRFEDSGHYILEDQQEVVGNLVLDFFSKGPMISYNIASALPAMAASQPDALAIAFPEKNSLDPRGITQYQKLTFKELNFETVCVARGLGAAGYKQGDRVVVMVPPGFDFFILAFAMLQTGIVAVYIDPGIGLKKLKECIEEVEPVGFIGITKAHVARVLLGWGKKTIRKTVTLGSRLFWSGMNMHAIRRYDRHEGPGPVFDAGPDAYMAAIIFTSGSTGIPKGAVYTHGNFKAQLEMIREAFDFVPGEIDMPTFPPFALFNPALGMSSIIPDMDPTKPAFVNPQHIIGPIKQFGITTMFGSPALLNTVGRYAEANAIKLPGLKRVISAGAPASTKTLLRFASILGPKVQIYTPYGSTESMPLTKIGSHQILSETQQKTANGAGICVGKPLAGIELTIIRISDEEVPVWSEDLCVKSGTVGEIVVKGRNVTRSYYNRDHATRLAKIKDGHEIRHRMGDLGYYDAAGDLWFCGRKSHRVKAGDEELYSVQVEEIFNKHPAVFRTALVGVDGKAVLCVEIEKNNDPFDPSGLKAELLAWAAAHPLTGAIRTLLFHPGFPVDFRHNAKIIREQVAVWAKKELA